MKFEQGIFILKPGFIHYVDMMQQVCTDNNLVVVRQKVRRLTRAEIIGLYPEIFTDRADDATFGERWKQDTIDYLISAKSTISLIEGANVLEKLLELKRHLRDIEAKDVRPPVTLSREEFINTSIKNVAHTVDNPDIPRMLWLFNLKTRQ